MKLQDCKPGVRVAIKLGGKIHNRGVIDWVSERGEVHIEYDDKSKAHSGTWYPEQLRRLKPKRKVRRWTMAEIGTAFDSTNSDQDFFTALEAIAEKREAEGKGKP